MRTLTIAAIQTAPIPFDVEATWQRFADQVRAVRDTFPHVELVVVPELMLAAEAPLLQARADWMDEVAQPLTGPHLDRICSLAEETGLWLVPGSLYERDDDKIYNTAVAVSPLGEVVARYRKIFPWQPYEQTSPGNEFVVFDIPGTGRIGLAICYDGSFPETARQLAWLGADVIIQPTLTTTRDREMELVCSRANAWTNQVYVVNVNGADPAGVGASVVVDPEGVIRQQAGSGEEVLVDTLDLDAVTRVRTYGTFGLNRPWDQLARHGAQIHLPMYGAAIRTPSWHGDTLAIPASPAH
ncbi:MULTISPECIES: carbon-nitrogen hydrolase family protein [unclassified Rhodococcus (in: high G+C Gram-positive bacteria)]|uniref:carbon-nitrogen hydrolase family protein n=1 Tax=unclassified Rhodococcus (in: high G+C Gram-positive bacteria) TaxID=192944 RepID=UPI001639850A|nr:MULTISPECIES: carbon-nitrogen hydrolase family protein [unclassified Rhodococcus (in: high G+C Gram-positive bacteria)]MBC2641269.1 carbon-nitrogen hydrolase family protein [Rhodococcus sp. 3A]MBC2893986.1 carbon-nitrogen hydrolase family protein [Rhodococcus sp. 4CII]